MPCWAVLRAWPVEIQPLLARPAQQSSIDAARVNCGFWRDAKAIFKASLLLTCSRCGMP